MRRLTSAAGAAGPGLGLLALLLLPLRPPNLPGAPPVRARSLVLSAQALGMIHSHPGGTRCFYYFPGTEVASSDARSFTLEPYPVDTIMCGNRIVWIGRDLVEQQQLLAAEAGAAP